MKQTALYRRMVRRIEKIIRDLRDTIAVAQWWAANRTADRPLDCEPERVALAKAIQAREALRRKDMAAFGTLMDDLKDYLTGGR